MDQPRTLSHRGLLSTGGGDTDEDDRLLSDDASWCRAGSGDDQPLVAVHTWPQEDQHYEALSSAWGDQPIYSILPPRFDSPDLPRRVDEWVDHVLAVLGELPVQPPYRLVGWSFGGVIALETARRLSERGIEVSFVGMIDTTRPKLRPLTTREYVWYHLGEAVNITEERRRIRYLAGSARVFVRRRFPRTTRSVHWVLRPIRPPKESKARRVQHPARPTDPLRISIHVSYLNYRGGAVGFPVSLYVTAPSVARAGTPSLRWGPWLQSGYEIASIPGDHSTLFDADNVGRLAEALRRSLAIVDLRSTTMPEHADASGAAISIRS